MDAQLSFSAEGKTLPHPNAVDASAMPVLQPPYSALSPQIISGQMATQQTRVDNCGLAGVQVLSASTGDNQVPTLMYGVQNVMGVQTNAQMSALQQLPQQDSMKFPTNVQHGQNFHIHAFLEQNPMPQPSYQSPPAQQQIVLQPAVAEQSPQMIYPAAVRQEAITQQVRMEQQYEMDHLSFNAQTSAVPETAGQMQQTLTAHEQLPYIQPPMPQVPVQRSSELEKSACPSQMGNASILEQPVLSRPLAVSSEQMLSQPNLMQNPAEPLYIQIPPMDPYRQQPLAPDHALCTQTAIASSAVLPEQLMYSQQILQPSDQPCYVQQTIPVSEQLKNTQQDRVDQIMYPRQATLPAEQPVYPQHSLLVEKPGYPPQAASAELHAYVQQTMPVEKQFVQQAEQAICPQLTKHSSEQPIYAQQPVLSSEKIGYGQQAMPSAEVLQHAKPAAPCEQAKYIQQVVPPANQMGYAQPMPQSVEQLVFSQQGIPQVDKALYAQHSVPPSELQPVCSQQVLTVSEQQQGMQLPEHQAMPVCGQAPVYGQQVLPPPELQPVYTQHGVSQPEQAAVFSQHGVLQHEQQPVYVQSSVLPHEQPVYTVTAVPLPEQPMHPQHRKPPPENLVYSQHVPQQTDQQILYAQQMYAQHGVIGSEKPVFTQHAVTQMDQPVYAQHAVPPMEQQPMYSQQIVPPLEQPMYVQHSVPSSEQSVFIAHAVQPSDQLGYQQHVQKTDQPIGVLQGQPINIQNAPNDQYLYAREAALPSEQKYNQQAVAPPVQPTLVPPPQLVCNQQVPPTAEQQAYTQSATHHMQANTHLMAATDQIPLSQHGVPLAEQQAHLQRTLSPQPMFVPQPASLAEHVYIQQAAPSVDQQLYARQAALQSNQSLYMSQPMTATHQPLYAPVQHVPAAEHPVMYSHGVPASVHGHLPPSDRLAYVHNPIPSSEQLAYGLNPISSAEKTNYAQASDQPANLHLQKTMTPPQELRADLQAESHVHHAQQSQSLDQQTMLRQPETEQNAQTDTSQVSHSSSLGSQPSNQVFVPPVRSTQHFPVAAPHVQPLTCVPPSEHDQTSQLLTLQQPHNDLQSGLHVNAPLATQESLIQATYNQHPPVQACEPQAPEGLDYMAMSHSQAATAQMSFQSQVPPVSLEQPATGPVLQPQPSLHVDINDSPQSVDYPKPVGSAPIGLTTEAPLLIAHQVLTPALQAQGQLLQTVPESQTVSACS